MQLRFYLVLQLLEAEHGLGRYSLEIQLLLLLLFQLLLGLHFLIHYAGFRVYLQAGKLLLIASVGIPCYQSLNDGFVTQWTSAIYVHLLL